MTGGTQVTLRLSRMVARRLFNFEGTGFRYLIQELLIMLRDERYECNRLTDDEACSILKVLNKLED